MQNSAETFSILHSIGQAFYDFWWLFFPPLLFFIFKIIWADYALVHSATSWIKKMEWTFLEIIPPKEIEKGPKLMESFFTGITGVLTTYSTFDQYLKGAYAHDRFSVELVGEEGKVHFYVRTQKKYRNLIEAQLYAQYPDAEINEVPDYTLRFPKVIPNKNWDLWGSDFEFTDPHPFPIRTYDRFEESVTGEMIDPMAAITEVLGKLGPGQYIWLQYVLQPLPEKWNKEKKQRAVVDKITGRNQVASKSIWNDFTDVFSNLWAGLFSPVEFKKAEKKEQQPLEFRLTPVEKDVLKALEENLGKNFFMVKMRFIYLGRKETFDKGFVSSFVGAVKQFNEINFNQLKPNDISKTYGNYLLKKSRMAFRQRKIYNRYRNRNMDGAKMNMSVKELATVFHFPDMGVKSPAVPRVASKLGSAPANLPVE